MLDGPGLPVAAFVLTWSWLVLAVGRAVNAVTHGRQDNAETRYGTVVAAD